MTSLSKKTYRRRKKKLTAQARKRKRSVRSLGTTPPFPIDPKEETGDSREKRDKMMSGRK
jgi:hypothetical protein